MNKETLTPEEAKLLAMVRAVKNGSGHGEVVATIQEGKIKLVKQTHTVKL